MNEKKFHVGIKALIQNEEGKILILRTSPGKLVKVIRTKGVPKELHEKGYWDIPGGRIEEGMSLEETLKKEVEEETGLDWSLVQEKEFFYGNIAHIEISVEDEKFGIVLLTYLCKLEKTPENIKLKIDEHNEFKWASINEAKELLSTKYSDDFIERLDKLR